MSARLHTRLAALTAGAALCVAGPLAHPAAAAGYRERVAVDVRSSGGATTDAWLLAGATYDVVVDGTYRYGGANELADAECSTRNRVSWTRDQFGPTALDLLVDGAAVDWTPTGGVLSCETLHHQYRTSFVPARTGPLTFRVEPGPGDRSAYEGILSVTIDGDSATSAANGTSAAADEETAEAPAQTEKASPPPEPSPAPAAAPDDGAPASQPRAHRPSGRSSTPAPADGPAPRPAPAPPAAAEEVAPPRSALRRTLADYYLGDQPAETKSVGRELAVEAAHQAPDGSQGTSPALLVLPLALAAVVAMSPRRTLRLAKAVSRQSNGTPWRTTSSAAPSGPPSDLERPILPPRR